MWMDGRLHVKMSPITFGRLFFGMTISMLQKILTSTTSQLSLSGSLSFVATKLVLATLNLKSVIGFLRGSLRHIEILGKKSSNCNYLSLSLHLSSHPAAKLRRGGVYKNTQSRAKLTLISRPSRLIKRKNPLKMKYYAETRCIQIHTIHLCGVAHSDKHCPGFRANAHDR